MVGHVGIVGRKLFALLMMILAIQETAWTLVRRHFPCHSVSDPHPNVASAWLFFTTVPQTRARLVAKKQASANVCSGFIGMATPRTLGVATDHMNTSV